MRILLVIFSSSVFFFTTSCSFTTTREEAYGYEDISKDPEFRAKIRQVAIDNQKDLSRCYEDALKETPGAHGTIKLIWMVDDQGKVTHTSVVDNGTKSQPLADCVMNESADWTFPPSPEKGKPMKIIYPLNFSEK